MKLWTYMIITIVLALLFEAAGIPIASGFLEIIGLDVETGIVAESTFRARVLLVLAAASVIGIGASLLTRAPIASYILVRLVVAGGAVWVFSGVLYGLLNEAWKLGINWIGWLVTLLVGPLAIGFIWALVEFFQGTN